LSVPAIAGTNFHENFSAQTTAINATDILKKSAHYQSRKLLTNVNNLFEFSFLSIIKMLNN